MNRKERRRQNKAQQKKGAHAGTGTFRPPPSGGASSMLLNYATGGKAEIPAVPSLADELPHAASLMQAGQFGEAQLVCDRLLKFFPKDPDLNHLAGLIAMQSGQAGKAKALLQTAIDGAPDYVEAHTNLATLLHRMGDSAGAEIAYRQVIDLKPDFVDALYNFGTLYVETGRFEASVPIFEKAIQLDPHQADLYLGLSHAAHALGDGAAARNNVNRALEIEPNNVSALVHKAELYSDEEAFGEAKPLLEVAAKLSPEIAEIHRRLGYVQRHLGDLDDAVASLRTTVRLAPDSPDALVGLGDALETNGEIEEAEALYRKALQIDPTYGDGLAKLGLLLAANNQYEEAEDPLQRALKLYPDNPQIKFSLGATRRSSGDYEAAVPLYQAALALDSSYAAGYWEMGHALESIGRNDEAIAAYEECLAREPDNGVARHLMSALKGETTETAPASYVEELFDDYASTFDQSLVNDLEYQSPERIRELVAELPDTPFGSMLDLGCGTGLVAEAVSEYVERIIGVDLSQKMLDEANRKGIYAETYHSELVAFLDDDDQSIGRFDLAVAGDVLTYMGNLTPVFSGVCGRLNVGGRFIFTVEALEDDDPLGFALRPSGRYAHSENYVRTEAERAGLAVSTMRPTVLRMDEGRSVHGLLVFAVLR